MIKGNKQIIKFHRLNVHWLSTSVSVHFYSFAHRLCGMEKSMIDTNQLNRCNQWTMREENAKNIYWKIFANQKKWRRRKRVLRIECISSCNHTSFHNWTGDFEFAEEFPRFLDRRVEHNGWCNWHPISPIEFGIQHPQVSPRIDEPKRMKLSTERHRKISFCFCLSRQKSTERSKFSESTPRNFIDIYKWISNLQNIRLEIWYWSAA